MAIKVIIVDDSRIDLLVMESMARNLGLEVHSFINPVECMAYIKDNGADILLTDYNMPQMNGLTILKESRRLYDDIPIVMITAAEADKSLELGALENGVTDFLKKPINMTTFTAKMKNLVALRNLQLLQKDRARLLEAEVKRATSTIIDREFETLQILGKAAEYRDPNTRNHEERIGQYTSLIAKGLGLDEEEQNLINSLHRPCSDHRHPISYEVPLHSAHPTRP